MRVVAFDPFLSPERAVDLAVEKVELDELFHRADFITLHTPLNAHTRGIVTAPSIARMKPGLRIVHCPRGGLFVAADPIGRGSWRVIGVQYGLLSVVALSIKKT